MSFTSFLKSDSLPWLLEPDPANPAIRYFALRDLLDRPTGDPELAQAQAAIMRSGAAPAILAAQQPDGYWVKPGTGYSPKYRGTVWQIILLAELGADPADARLRRGCEYILAHSRAANGAFAYNSLPVPSGAVHCLNGNLLAALITFGYLEDTRLQTMLAWLADSITGENAFHFHKSGIAAAGFACGVNLGQPCGWGAAKALKALAAVPASRRTPAQQRAVAAGVEFLFSRDPATADYPYTGRVSGAWFKFGFPLSYWSDVLEITALLADLGYARDPRLARAVQYILGKQDAHGRWKLENNLNQKMWQNIEQQGKPSKWVTLRALRLLKHFQA